MKSDFPSYKSTAKLGEHGVSIISRVISDSFGWLFKRNHQEHDFGIDGQVELVTELGAVTGQMFAVQIKCGKSFLAEKNKWGYVYRGEAKHFNYLANYPIPVIICLCDPESSQCFWVLFKPELTQATGEAWKMTVPFENVLSTSQNQLMSIVPPVQDAASELQSYWDMNNMLITGSGIIIYALDEHDINNQELTLPREFFNRLRLTKELAYACQGRVELVFFGYDDDPRELYEIPEIRDYVALLDFVLVDLFFFVRSETESYTLVTFALCQTNIEWVDEHATKKGVKKICFDPRPVTDFVERHWPGLNELTDWLDMPVEENKHISFAILRRLGIGPSSDERS